MPSEPSWLALVWTWARSNDIPNWFALAFTAILWPVALLLWHRRKVQGIPGLEVHFSPGNIQFGGATYDAIAIQFTNHTASVAYVSAARITRYTRAFPVPIQASRDVADNSYHLKFMSTPDPGPFDKREITLQTGESAHSGMPVTAPMDAGFYRHTSSWLARRLRHPKYFILEYTAMVGSTRYSVATCY